MRAGAIRGGKMGGTLTAWHAATLRALRRSGAAIVLLLLAAGLALRWPARWTPDRALYPSQGVSIDAGNGAAHWGWIKDGSAESRVGKKCVRSGEAGVARVLEKKK